MSSRVVDHSATFRLSDSKESVTTGLGASIHPQGTSRSSELALVYRPLPLAAEPIYTPDLPNSTPSPAASTIPCDPIPSLTATSLHARPPPVTTPHPKTPAVPELAAPSH